jgi:TRAP-type C4-dicarboxylate transport system permease small subunit
MKAVKYLSKLSDVINTVAKYFVFFLMIFLVLIVFAEVIARFILNTSLRYTEEIVIYSMAWMIFIGVGVAAKENALISMVGLLQLLTPKAVRLITIIGNILIITLLAWIVKSGMFYALRNIAQLSPTLQIPMMYPYLSIPVGCAILLLHYINSVLKLFSKE